MIAIWDRGVALTKHMWIGDWPKKCPHCGAAIQLVWPIGAEKKPSKWRAECTARCGFMLWRDGL